MSAHQVVILRGCERCGLGFLSRKKSHRWCSNACRVAAHQQRKAKTQRLIAETMFKLAEEGRA